MVNCPMWISSLSMSVPDQVLYVTIAGRATVFTFPHMLLTMTSRNQQLPKLPMSSPRVSILPWQVGKPIWRLKKTFTSVTKICNRAMRSPISLGYTSCSISHRSQILIASPPCLLEYLRRINLGMLKTLGYYLAFDD